MKVKIIITEEEYPNLYQIPNAAKLIQEFLERNDIPITEIAAYSQAAMLESELAMSFE